MQRQLWAELPEELRSFLALSPIAGAHPPSPAPNLLETPSKTLSAVGTKSVCCT